MEGIQGTVRYCTDPPAADSHLGHLEQHDIWDSIMDSNEHLAAVEEDVERKRVAQNPFERKFTDLV